MVLRIAVIAVLALMALGLKVEAQSYCYRGQNFFAFCNQVFTGSGGSGPPPPPTCPNQLDFSVPCNSQYIPAVM
jgi:hypothetical protein